MQLTAGSGHSITLLLQTSVCLPPWPSPHLKESLKVTAWMLMSEAQVGSVMGSYYYFPFMSCYVEHHVENSTLPVVISFQMVLHL